MQTKVRLDIDIVPETLYQMLLDEFKKQHGEGIYDDWNITAKVEFSKGGNGK